MNWSGSAQVNVRRTVDDGHVRAIGSRNFHFSLKSLPQRCRDDVMVGSGHTTSVQVMTWSVGVKGRKSLTDSVEDVVKASSEASFDQDPQ